MVIETHTTVISSMLVTELSLKRPAPQPVHHGYSERLFGIPNTVRIVNSNLVWSFKGVVRLSDSQSKA